MSRMIRSGDTWHPPTQPYLSPYLSSNAYPAPSERERAMVKRTTADGQPKIPKRPKEGR